MDLFPPLVDHQVICCLYTFSCHVTTPAPSLTMLTCHTIYKQVVSGATKLLSCSTLLPFSILILPIHMTIRWLKEAQPILYQFKDKLSQSKNWTTTYTNLPVPDIYNHIMLEPNRSHVLQVRGECLQNVNQEHYCQGIDDIIYKIYILRSHQLFLYYNYMVYLLEKNCHDSGSTNVTVGRLLADCRPTVVYRFYENLLPVVGRLLAVCRPTVGRMSVICRPSVGWEPLSNTRKASARKEEHCISTRNETFSLESAILFWFF